MNHDFDPHAILEQVSVQADEEIDLAHVALALAMVQHEGISAERYIHHLKQIIEDVAVRFDALLQEGGEDSAALRLAALCSVMSDQYGYSGDVQSYDDLQNASLIHVIDRAKGLPITLSILYIHAGRAQGWSVDGLNMPGHFVCRLEKDGQRLIFDPFQDGKIMEAQDLRANLKNSIGPEAELSSEYYERSSNREILIRLQNNLKYRKIDAEDYEGALAVVELMRKIAPDEYRLLLDAGVLYARTDQPKAAIATLAEYIEHAPNSRDRYEAEMLLSELSGQLN
jgi:regulator of sirC expression with transglutaminase-like and TPR domain